MSVDIPEEGKMLSEALNTVKIQTQQMKRFLEMDQLMDALKSASTMLSELRTSSLTPKQYYELYMGVFDALRHLSNYLFEAHTQGKHHLADLYELVQYAGNIVPRLYLMITVGSVYMSVPDAPVKEIMRDMMEMSRGVQHPTRGLFLRHYLSGQTRDHLPEGIDDGPGGNLQDSISFVLSNFIEMNKLWVRLQHQGHSRDREKREMERKELRILVGTNLVRLSQLEGVDFDMYQRIILPGILEQVVNCRDVIAQEYLMEVVIQVFTDEFHLYSLGPFLTATAQLQPKVNIKQIVIALIDRLASYAAREAENDNPEETKKQEEAAAKRLAEKVKMQKARIRAMENGNGSATTVHTVEGEIGGGWDSPPSSPTTQETVTAFDGMSLNNGTGGSDLSSASLNTLSPTEKGKDKEIVGTAAMKKFRGVPENVRLFEVFWRQVVELIKARPDLSIPDITALLVSMMNLSLSCYPDRLEYVDQILGFAHDKLEEFAQSPDLHALQTTNYLASLLLAPINSYQSILTLLALPRYASLLLLQPFSTRRSLAHSIVASVLKNETVIDTPEDVSGVLELCQVLIRDQMDTAFAAKQQAQAHAQMNSRAPDGHSGWRSAPVHSSSLADREEMAEEQGWIARMVHLFRSDSLDVQFELLQAARRYFETGGERIRYTYPSLITSAIKLCRRYKNRQDVVDDERETKVTSILKFVRQLTSILATVVDAPNIALRLFLLAAQISDECGPRFENVCYDFYVQAFTVYEDCISESRAQLQAITLIIGTLQGAKAFSTDNYDTLITKATLHGAKLLKKSHQATAVHLASHMWWQEEEGKVISEKNNVSTTSADANPKKEEAAEDRRSYPLRDSSRILECLQKCLRIATSATEEIITVQLYCDALDQYLYYLDRKAEAVKPKFVNSLVELITSSISNISSPDIHPSQRAPPGLIEGVQTPDMITKHFINTLIHIQNRKHAYASGTSDKESKEKWNEVEVVGALLKMGLQ